MQLHMCDIIIAFDDVLNSTHLINVTSANYFNLLLLLLL